MEIRLAHPVERFRRLRLALVPGARERLLETHETLLGNVGKKLVAVAIVAVRRSGTDAGPARRFGKSEARRTLLGDQFQRRTDQRLLEVAVVVAARLLPPRFAAAVLRPAHVKSIYITA